MWSFWIVSPYYFLFLFTPSLSFNHGFAESFVFRCYLFLQTSPCFCFLIYWFVFDLHWFGFVFLSPSPLLWLHSSFSFSSFPSSSSPPPPPLPLSCTNPACSFPKEKKRKERKWTKSNWNENRMWLNTSDPFLSLVFSFSLVPRPALLTHYPILTQAKWAASITRWCHWWTL